MKLSKRKKRAKKHSTKEKAELRLKKRKEGGAAVRRREKRLPLQPKPAEPFLETVDAANPAHDE